MRRWNGWGDDSVVSELAPPAVGSIESFLGAGVVPRDIEFADAVRMVQPSRLGDHPLVITDPAERVRHARGQSLPDLIALRSGRGLVFPDGVAFPQSGEGVAELIRYASASGSHLIPYGGGTSVVGHVTVTRLDRPVLTVDLSRLNALEHLDGTSNLATFGAGISGAQLEALLRPRGYTLGHFPQSFELSTLGGWIATRSRGQQSIHYGGIDRLLAGAEVETPQGPLRLRAFVASSAGPDLRELILGSEGRLGLITSATVRISPIPDFEEFRAIFFGNWTHAVAAVRAAAQARVAASMLRLSDPTESALNLAVFADPETAEATTTALRGRGIGNGACLLIVGVTGGNRARATLDELVAAAAERGGVTLPGSTHGARWAAGRFQAPYLRNALWELGYAVDTVETATDWTRLDETRLAMEHALRTGLAELGERVFPFTHLSHVYPSGSSIYTTYLFRLAEDPEETLRRWSILKDAVSRTVIEHGATITHQHGVGLDHQPYLEAEKGSLGVDLLARVAAELDPYGMLNPGKLVR